MVTSTYMTCVLSAAGGVTLDRLAAEMLASEE